MLRVISRYPCISLKRDICKKIYLRQELIEQQFEKLLAAIKIDDEVKTMLLEGLRESMHDKIEYHNNLVSQLEKQIKLLQNRIDQAYLDKLDAKISEEFWQTHTKKWSLEKEELLIKQLALHKADVHYLENANLAIELTNKVSAC